MSYVTYIGCVGYKSTHFIKLYKKTFKVYKKR